MWRTLLLFCLMLMLVTEACRSGTSNTGRPVQPQASVSPTVQTKKGTCEPDLPKMTLRYGGVTQRDTRIGVDWVSPSLGCAINGHPFDTIPVPKVPLRLVQGERPLLTFDPAPLRASGFAWQPDFAGASEPADGLMEVSIPVRTTEQTTELVLWPVASQELVLDNLPPGDYVLQLSGRWPDGTTGYAFRVLIEAP